MMSNTAFKLQSLRFRLVLPPIVALCGFVILGLIALEVLQHNARTAKEQTLMSVVDLASGIAAHYQGLESKGALSREAAQEQARLAIKALRYNDIEYLWINDMGKPYAKMIMHPTVPSLDGQPLDKESFNRATAYYSADHKIDAPLDNKNLFSAFVEIVDKAGNGFVAYAWPKPRKDGSVTAELFPKLSYVKGFHPWNWVIGSGVYIDDLEAFYRNALVITGGLTLAIATLTLIAALYMRRRILHEIGGEPMDAAEKMWKIANGNINIDIQTREGDNASLMASLKVMQMKLMNIASSIHDNSTALSEQAQAFDKVARSYAVSKSVEDLTALQRSASKLNKIADILNKSISRLKL